jgi:exodeoxyribonuclease-3
MTVRLVSWNVNGIRSVIRKGFWDWLQIDTPDLLCLQETRIHTDQLTGRMRNPTGYYSHWVTGEKRGYSGVATFSRREPQAVRTGMGEPQFDVEGRVLTTQFPAFTLVNAYFPSGQRGHERVAYKLEFYDALLSYCQDLRAEGHRLVICGDFNTAHQAIDLARPKQNKKTSGFLPEEREALTRWLESGFVDSFRALNLDEVAYSWWTYRANARARNVGWRLDYFLVDEALMQFVQDASILSDIPGSDHCPIALRLDL